MTTANPVTPDISALLGNADQPQTVADFAMLFEGKAEKLCEAYVQHRLNGGKTKAFLATLSKEDQTFFAALQLETMAKLAIKEHLDANPDDDDVKSVYDAMVAKEIERQAVVADVTGANLAGNPNKPAKDGKKSGKKGKGGNKGEECGTLIAQMEKKMAKKKGFGLSDAFGMLRDKSAKKTKIAMENFVAENLH
jgi:hypothetical protein